MAYANLAEGLGSVAINPGPARPMTTKPAAKTGRHCREYRLIVALTFIKRQAARSGHRHEIDRNQEKPESLQQPTGKRVSCPRQKPRGMPASARDAGKIKQRRVFLAHDQSPVPPTSIHLPAITSAQPTVSVAAPAFA